MGETGQQFLLPSRSRKFAIPIAGAVKMRSRKR
jgi:hypothetical protein